MFDLLKRVPLFADLTEDQLDIVSSITSILEFNPNTVLFKEGEPGETFCIVVQGSVKVYTSNRTGQQKILAVIQSGDSFGELALIDGKPRSATVETLEDTTLLIIKNESFHLLLRAHYDIARKIMIQLCGRLRATNGHVYDLTFLDPSARIVKSIVHSAQMFGERKGDHILIHAPFDREAMSGLAGVHQNALDDIVLRLEKEQILMIGCREYSLNVTRLYNSPYVG